MDASASIRQPLSSPLPDRRNYGGLPSPQQLHYHRTLVALLVAVALFAFNIQTVSSLLCYKCTSNEPGCTLDKVDWLIHSAKSCPKNNDKCVKIIEQRGADLRVVRGCLSDVMPYRRDIPADHYEGCRPSSPNPSKSVYVFNEIKELELKERYYNNVTYCFCEFDHWCNAAPARHHHSSMFALMVAGAIGAFLTNRFWS